MTAGDSPKEMKERNIFYDILPFQVSNLPELSFLEASFSNTAQYFVFVASALRQGITAHSRDVTGIIFANYGALLNACLSILFILVVGLRIMYLPKDCFVLRLCMFSR